MPEVPLEQTIKADVHAWTVPQGHHGLAIVALPQVDALLWPQVDHVLHGVDEGMREDGSQVAGQSCTEHLDWPGGSVGCPPDHG